MKRGAKADNTLVSALGDRGAHASLLGISKSCCWRQRKSQRQLSGVMQSSGFPFPPLRVTAASDLTPLTRMPGGVHSCFDLSRDL